MRHLKKDLGLKEILVIFIMAIACDIWFNSLKNLGMIVLMCLTALVGIVTLQIIMNTIFKTIELIIVKAWRHRKWEKCT